MVGEKNWLIRTTKNQILGPISKDKLLEFIKKNALSLNDEVSSGNGYWFLIREKELVEKYIFGDIAQSFNPISEAPNVLTANLYSGKADKTGSMNKVPGIKQHHDVMSDNDEHEMKLPEDSDLEFPDMGEFDDLKDSDYSDDVTLVLPRAPIDAMGDTPESHTGGGDVTDITLVGDKDERALVPSQDDLEYPDEDMVTVEDDSYEMQSAEFLVQLPEEEEEEVREPSAPNISLDVPETKKTVDRIQKVQPLVKESTFKKSSTSQVKDEVKAKAKKAPAKKKSQPAPVARSDRYLFFVLFLLLILTMGIFYYYRKILNKPLPIIGISYVHAQELSPIKKKVF